MRDLFDVGIIRGRLNHMDLKNCKTILKNMLDNADRACKDKPGDMPNIIYLTAERYNLTIIRLFPSSTEFASVAMIDKSGSEWAILVSFWHDGRLYAYGIKNPSGQNWDDVSINHALLDVVLEDVDTNT